MFEAKLWQVIFHTVRLTIPKLLNVFHCLSYITTVFVFRCYLLRDHRCPHVHSAPFPLTPLTCGWHQVDVNDNETGDWQTDRWAGFQISVVRKKVVLRNCFVYSPVQHVASCDCLACARWAVKPDFTRRLLSIMCNTTHRLVLVWNGACVFVEPYNECREFSFTANVPGSKLTFLIQDPKHRI